MDRFVAGLVAAPELPRDWAEVRPLLRPVLRGGTPGSPLRRPVLPFLYEYVVVDQPETMTYVGPDQPAGWGVSAEQVFAAARANLSGAVLQGVASEPVVVRFVDDGDAYWTSHLLLEHWLERLAGQVGGVPVAFAPERGTLLVTADGSEHLRGLFAQAEEIYAGSARPITPMAYVYDERGCTVPYTVAPDHPLHQTVRRAERVLAVHEYSRQAAQPPDEPPAQPPDEPPAQPPDEPPAQPAEPAAPPDDRTDAPGRGASAAPQGKDAAGSGMGAATTGMDAAAQATNATAHQTDTAAHATDATAHGVAAAMAELRLVGSADEGWRTRAIWDRDEAVLLPEADEVQVGEDVRPWNELLPHLTVVTGCEPARWAATGWPQI
ncbi:hypothetical protein [Actinoplanes subtropicus]|uniref:hypothetical protein n=1 Tax=Actinoplanes subtropicus TaxID=543632 RepID=UPI000A573F54|nr:hypothetical protein [Actinoplanes subtropicus]